MTLSEDIEAGLAELEELVPQTVTINGADYPCVPGSKTKGGNLDIGGLSISFDFSCTIRRSLFDVLPKKGQALINGSDTLRIESVVESPTGSHIRVLCVSQNRGI